MILLFKKIHKLRNISTCRLDEKDEEDRSNRTLLMLFEALKSSKLYKSLIRKHNIIFKVERVPYISSI